MTTPWGELDLDRFPEDPRDRLRAWDASDAYLLTHLVEERVPLDGTVVVLGDRWGALATALAARRAAREQAREAAQPEAARDEPAHDEAARDGGAHLVQITDSFLTREATRANLARAGAEPGAVSLLTTQDPPPERIDVLLVRVPKSLALLEDQLLRLAPAVHAGTVVVGTGMVKEIHTSTLRLFEQILGPTRTSLAVRKARLIHTAPDPSLDRPANPWPYEYTLPGDIGAVSGGMVVNHAGVFCADRLDIGTRFLLRHLPPTRDARRVVDLGCGNGVVGTAVAMADPEAEVLFVDESFQAVASAEATFKANGVPGHAEFRVGDGLAGVSAGSVDLVLNNPPFHSHQATTDATAWRMFTGAQRVLRPGGELWVVGNRHLGYHVKLKRLFGTCELVASDPKFVLLRAVKR
ncbi:methyltransferase [Streptomyces mangrovisoli]|uniref:Ribosomal RNA large subunit methyltransferase G n=1 Tax=Streptomyces mangrovisoli TaxID=1428628 RepID=A0A1J4P4X9_9ACTN|nr:methyltransferase [Streptomyces mangrovisoli]OIJ68518.1 50S rRNA methyltransferase [Streptomyces mangrovisoli]